MRSKCYETWNTIDKSCHVHKMCWIIVKKIEISIKIFKKIPRPSWKSLIGKTCELSLASIYDMTSNSFSFLFISHIFVGYLQSKWFIYMRISKSYLTYVRLGDKTKKIYILIQNYVPLKKKLATVFLTVPLCSIYFIWYFFFDCVSN